MSSSVSRHASPRVLKTVVLLTGIFGQSLFAQQAPASSVKAAPALKISGKVASSNATHVTTDAAAQKKAELQYLHLPLSFEQNQGQADARVKFLSRGAGYGLFLTNDETLLSFGGQKPSAIRMHFLGSQSSAAVTASDRLPGTSNYFLGNDRTKWRTNVPNFGKVEYKNLYSGIDLVYYGNQQRIEHDFVLAPHADATKIKFAIDGAKKLALEKSGDLVVTTAAGEMRLRKPAIYQTINGQRKEIAGGYALKHSNQVSFALGAYDRDRELTIDPVLILSTYLADTAGVSATGVAVDGTGIYVTGTTRAAQFSSVTPALNNRGNQTIPNEDIYVVKLDSAGNHLIYSAIIGGAGTDNATSIAIDGSSNAYVGGFTQSADFPTAAVFGSNTPYQSTSSSTQDGFFLQLNSTGTALSYSSYFGGTGNSDAVNGIAVTGGQIYLTGKTDSTSGISTANSFQSSLSGTTLNAFIAAINPAGNNTNDLTYGTYFGGTASDSGNGIAVAGANGVFVTGNATSADFPVSNGSALDTQTQDAFVARIDTTNSTDVSGVCLDGTTHTDELTTASTHNFVVGETVLVSGFGAGATGTSFNGQFTITAVPTSTTLQYIDSSCTSNGDASTSNGNVTGGRVYATYFGGGAVGTTSTSGNAIALDGSGSAYITGQTSATAGIASGGVFQNALNGTSDAYVAKFDGTGTVIYGTYLGGTADEQGNAIAVDGGGNAYVSGFTTSPTALANANALYSSLQGTQDAFVAKVDSTAATLIYSTYLGGSGTDSSNGIALSSSGAAVVAGSSNSGDLVTTASAFQPTATGSNAFVASLDAAPATTATLVFGTNTATPASVLADTNNHDQITYQYVIQNTSATDSAHSAVFNDPIPGGFATPRVVVNSANFKSGNSPQSCPLVAPSSCSFGPGGVTCQIGTIDDTTTATNSVSTVCIAATPNDLAPGTTIHNTNVTVASAETTAVMGSDLDTPVDTSTKITTSITQTAPANPVANNASVTYSVTVSNDGPNDIPAGKAMLTITSAGTPGSTLTLTSLGSSDGGDTCTFGTGVCMLGVFTHGTSRTITAIGTAVETSGHQDTITVTATTAPVNPGDFRFDTGSTQSANTATIVQPVANLTTTVSNTTPGGGAVTVANNTNGVVYTVNIHNTGDKITTGKLAGNLFSAGVSLNSVAHSVTSGTGICTFDNTAHTYTCDNIAVDNGTDFTLTLTGTVIEATGKQQVLTVTTSIAPETAGDYGITGGSTIAASDTNVTVQPVANLITSVATTASTITPNNTAGAQYTVSVQNQGPDSISAAHITGSLGDVNVSLSGASTAGPCTIDDSGHTFDCSNVPIGNATTFTVTFTGTATETTGKQQILTISTTVVPQTVGDFAFGGSSMPTHSNSSVTVQPIADIGINTITGSSTVNNNGTATYTFTVTDNGPDDVSTAQVKGSFSGNGVVFTSAAGTSAFCSLVGQNFTCNLPFLKGSGGSNRSSTITLQGPATETNGKQTTLLLGAVSSPSQIKVAPATGGDYNDGNSANDAAGGQPFSTNVVPVAKLVTAVVQTIPVSTTVANNTGGVKYQISVNNQGPDDLTNLTLGGTFSSVGVSLNSATIGDIAGNPISGCTVNNPAHSYSCTGINIANGGTATFFLVGTVVETTGVNTPLAVTATIAPGTAGDFTQGSGSVLNTQTITNVQPHANIASTFTTAPSDPLTFVPPPASASHTYIIKATNSGPDVIASSVLSGSFTNPNVTVNITSISPGAGGDSCTFTATTYSCTLGSFATGAGASHSFTVVADVSLNSGSASGSVTNNVLSVAPVIAGDFVNENGAVGGSSASARVLGSANLTLSFSGSASPVLVGNSFVYTATVSNAAGASDAAGVQVTIPLNSLLPGQVATGFSGQGSCSGTTTVVCTMGAGGAVPANTSATVQIAVQANSALVPNSGVGLPVGVTFSPGPPRSVTFLQSATVSVDSAQTINSNAANANQKTSSSFTAAAHITVAHTNSTAPALIDSTGTTYSNVVYTTTVTNIAGRSDAQNIVITDNPPVGPNVNFVSASVTPSGSCSGSGPVTCSMPLLASGNTDTITITLQPIRSATMPPASITDTISYTSSDVTDPTPGAGGLTDSSTIAVQNTVTNGTLPVQANSSGRTVQLRFGNVSTNGVTQFDTTASFAGLTLPLLYPLAAQPAQPLLYVFSTTATTSAPVKFCFDSVQTFAKPERVRMFLLSTGAPLDITFSVAPPAPTQLTGLSQVCGATAFSSGNVMLAILEPKNNAPVLNTSSAAQTNINPNQGTTGQIVLDATPTTDQDTNSCNGSQTTSCSDALAYLWTTTSSSGFTAANGTSLTGGTTPSTPLNQSLYNSGVFLPLGRSQSVTLAVNDQLNTTTSKTFTVDVLNTAAGNNQVVKPVDRQNLSFGTPATVTFASVGAGGITTLTTSPTVPLPPFPITVPNASDPTTQHRYIFGQNGVTTVYQLATDGTVSGATQVCINLAANQTFIKPDRARMFVLSNFSGSDITTSISPAAPGTQPTMVCGAVAGFGTPSSPTLVAILEPMNEAPEVKNSAIQQININPRQGITGELLLDATTAIDPDTDLCNGGSSTCMDTLSYLWTGSPSAFTDANGIALGSPTAPLSQKLYGGGIFLPIGRNQTVTLAITDQLGVTTTKAFPVDIINTPAGSLVNVNPVDGRMLAKGTPVSLTFSNVSSGGVTTLDTLAGQLPPSRFRFGTNGLRYNIVSDAVVSGSTQVCVDTSQQRFVKPERLRLLELSPTFADITTSITPVPAIPSKGQVVNQVCGVLAGYTTGTMQLAVLEPVNNAPVVGLTFNLSSAQDAGKGVTGNFVDLNPASSFDADTDFCNGGSTRCGDSPQLRFFMFGPFPGALQSTAANPIVRNISLPGGTSTITVAAVDQTVTIPSNVIIATPADLTNLTDGIAQNGLTITQFAVTIDSATPGGGSTGTTATILAGQSASFIFSPLNPAGGAIQGSGTLNLACSNGPTTPSLDSLHITCGVTPTTFTIGSSSALALLISTTGATIGLSQSSSGPGAPLYAVWVAFAGMPFAGIVIISIFGPGRRRRWLKLLLAFGLLVVAIGSQVACGGGSSMTPSTKFSTPRGTYEIVVTGTQNGTALSKNSFTITVQ